MFDYIDPAGQDFLGDREAEAAYRQIMQGFYDSFANRQNSAFTWLEAFGELLGDAQPSELTIDWRAFPLLAAATDQEIDQNRFSLQDEYVEWRVEHSGDALLQIVFTTELPEYFQAFAMVGTDSLIRAVQDVIPNADPTAEELFGITGNPDSLSPTARSRHFRENLPNNPWNNGKKGILCLTQRFNTMSALFNLVTECGVEQRDGSIEDTCALVGGACGVGRSSDPRICSESQAEVRNKSGITLKDPTGIRILELRDTWKIAGQPVNINNSDQNQGAWMLSRNGRRAVLDVTTGITLGDDPITTGAQVSNQLAIGADLLSATEVSLPDWAKTGNEGQRGTL